MPLVELQFVVVVFPDHTHLLFAINYFRYLRRMLLRTGCDVGVKAAIQYAKDKFAEWMYNGTRYFVINVECNAG